MLPAWGLQCNEAVTVEDLCIGLWVEGGTQSLASTSHSAQAPTATNTQHKHRLHVTQQHRDCGEIYRHVPPSLYQQVVILGEMWSDFG
jgi:hypothetical protein